MNSLAESAKAECEPARAPEPSPSEANSSSGGDVLEAENSGSPSVTSSFALPLAGLRWYVVQTEPSREYVARRSIGRLPVDMWLPERLERHHLVGRTLERPRPYLPGYLFVHFDASMTRWRAIDEAEGVLRLLVLNDRPVPVRAGDIERVREMADKAALPEPEPKSRRCLRWINGQRLRVTGGVFQGFEGPFLALTRDGIALDLEMFGRTVRSAIPETLAEPI